MMSMPDTGIPIPISTLRRKEAELLVKTDIPVKYIRGYVVYNEKAKAILLKYGIAEDMIKVAPNYYF